MIQLLLLLLPLVVITEKGKGKGKEKGKEKGKGKEKARERERTMARTPMAVLNHGVLTGHTPGMMLCSTMGEIGFVFNLIMDMAIQIGRRVLRIPYGGHNRPSISLQFFVGI